MEKITAFHGTGRDFKEFNSNTIGSHQNFGDDGFFFITNLEEAAWYANENPNCEESWNPSIITATITLKNPLIANAKTDMNFSNPTNYFDNNADTLYNAARKNGNDGIIINGMVDYYGIQLIVAFEPDQIIINDVTAL